MISDHVRLLLVLPALAMAQPVGAHTMTLRLALCAGGAVNIPVRKRGPEEQCPTACHAMMCERRLAKKER